MNGLKTKWIYLTFGVLSILFRGLYWFQLIHVSWRTVLMSIGSSLLGADALGFLIELSIMKQKVSVRKDTLVDLVNAAKSTVNELETVFREFKNDADIKIVFSSDKDFINKSMEYYLDLTDKRDETSDHLASYFKDCIYDDIVNKTFVVDHCKETCAYIDIVLNSQNELLTAGLINKEEIRILSSARARMGYFIRESENNRISILLSNALNFRDQLNSIINFIE